MPRQPAIAAAIASPIFGSKPYSNVHVGASITPSRLMNSCTRIAPISSLLRVCQLLRRPWRRKLIGARRDVDERVLVDPAADVDCGEAGVGEQREELVAVPLPHRQGVLLSAAVRA